MANGLVLTGEVRNVKQRKITPESGESFLQTVCVVDTGEDFLHTVVSPKGDEKRFTELLSPMVGKTVSIRVNNGQFQRLWFVELVA